MHYYQFNIGDYASHTAHLDPLEDIAYRRMLDYCYLNECGLPETIESIARVIRMRTHCDCIATVLQEFFFSHDDGTWHHTRVDNEILAYKGKSAKASESARKRWDNVDANALRTQSEGNANHKPITNNHKPITSNHKTKEDRSQQLADFELLWSSFDSAYGDKGSKKNALSQWIKINPDTELFGLIMNGIYKQRSEKQMKQSAGEFYAPFQHVERWLKNRRWEDEISVVNFSRTKPTREQRIEQALNEAFGTSDTGSIEGDFETIVGNGFAELNFGRGNG
jgi:uncharacterized protein YdaU (DUF1376 family)